MKIIISQIPVETLNLKNAKEEYFNLIEIKQKLDNAYYGEDEPLVDDKIYDALIKRAKQLQNHHQIEDINDSLNKVGHSKFSSKQLKFDEVEHKKQMLSLDNLFTNDDVIEFDKRIKRFLNLKMEYSLLYSCEPKIDGLSLSVIYENGIMKQALTRGDGFKGEDVTLNAKTIADIPQKLVGDFPYYLEVRGEVYMNKADFLQLNKEQESNNKKIFANPRNATAGSLRNLDVNITKSRPLKFMVWGLGQINNSDGSDYSFKEDSFFNYLNNLQYLGFKVNNLNSLCTSIEELIIYYDKMVKVRSSLNYDIDGIVYKVDALSLQNRLGIVGKSPRWAASHKFEAEKAITKINQITAQVGRTGVLTPIAELEPVNLGGVIVSRATLHNFEEVARKDIREYDKVLIQRAGDVIPQVLAVVNIEGRDSDSKAFVAPTSCPSCNSPLEYEDIYIRCSGGFFYCPSMFVEGLDHFVSEKGFNIEGFAGKQIQYFYNKGLIKQPSDIFLLKDNYEDIIHYEGFGKKSIDNLLQAIEKSKIIALNNFIYALGIKKVGNIISKTLAKKYKTIDNFIETFKNMEITDNLAEEVNINGIGKLIIQDIVNYFKNSKNIALVVDLLNYVQVTPYQELQIKDSLINGKTVLFTGALTKMSRNEAKVIAEKKGAIVLSSISKKLDYLVVGADAGSKLKKAQELNLNIISEEDFLNLIK